MKPATQVNMKPVTLHDEPKTEEYDIKLISLAIGAFIALTGLTIGIITQLKIYDLNKIYLLLSVMLIVLICGFWGKSIIRNIKIYQEKRRYNKLAKHYFRNFKKLVLLFGEFAENRVDNNIQSIMHDIKNKTEFSQINVIPALFIQQSYKYYQIHLTTSDETKDSLESLVTEFESILYMYDMLYINNPVYAIRTIGQDKLPKPNRESYNKARTKYVGFLNDYSKFAKVANDDFKDKEQTFAYGDRGIFKENFALPEEL